MGPARRYGVSDRVLLGPRGFTGSSQPVPWKRGRALSDLGYLVSRSFRSRLHLRRLVPLSALLAVSGLAVLSAGAAIAVEPGEGWPREAAATYSKEAGVSEAEAKRRLAVQARAGDIVRVLRAELAEDFAGVWIDRASGRFKVGLAPTTSKSAAASVLRQRGIENDADLVQVRSRWQELEAAKKRWVERAKGLLANQQAIVGIDPTRNAVTVEVSPRAAESDIDSVRRDAEKEDVVVRVEERPAENFDISAAACSWPYCDKPIRGGTRIFASNFRSSCTGGYLVRSLSDYKPYLLTAGHCFYGYIGEWWQTWNTAGDDRFYGQVHNAVRDSSGDVGIIKVTDPYWDPLPKPMVAAWTGNELHPLSGGTGWSYYGQFTCRLGATTNVRCGWNGAVDKAVPIDYCPGPPQCVVYVNHMTASSNCALEGDSGGPVIAYNTAYGITDAYVGSGCPTQGSYYMEAFWAENRVGVYLAN